MQQLVELFQFVCPLSEELMIEIYSLFKSRIIKKKELLLSVGQVFRFFSFVDNGLLRIYHYADNSEITTGFFKEGDFVWPVKSFFDQSPANECIQALENTTIYFITYDELQRLYRYKEFNYIGRVLAERQFKVWEEQNSVIRLSRAADRYQWLVEHQPHLVLRTAAKYIASYLGMSEVTLSKIRNKISR